MTTNHSGGRVLFLLSSLRLAVVVMVTLGSTCAFATFYEMRHGTPAVQRDIYQTWWFAALLGLLGLNVFTVMVSRYPWTKHHIGFLIAHVGILAVLAGSVLSLYRGLDSNMALYESETSDRVMLLEKALHVTVPSAEAHGSFPVVFEKRPPRPGQEQRFAVPGSDLALVAEDYQPHVAVAESFEPAANGAPAAHFALQAPMATQDGWLVAGDPERSHVDFGMVSLGVHTASTEAEAAQMLTGAEGPNHLSLVRGARREPALHRDGRERSPRARVSSSPADPSTPAGRRSASRSTASCRPGPSSARSRRRRRRPRKRSAAPRCAFTSRALPAAPSRSGFSGASSSR